MATISEGCMNLIKFFLLTILIVAMPRLSFAEKVFLFEGKVDFQTKEFNAVINLGEESLVTAKAEKTSEKDYSVSLDIEHVKTPLFDLLSRIESSVEIVNGADNNPMAFSDSNFRGKIWSRYSLVDYKPINELSGRFEVKDKRLYLTALSVGNLTCEGYVDLAPPYSLDMVLYLAGVDMHDFLNFWTAGKEYESSGAVFGKIRAAGILDRLELKGSLESRNGFVQKLDYNAIVLNIEGVYPHMQITQSTVSKSDGVSFSLDGPFNLSDIENFKKQIKSLTLSPLVNHSGSDSEWTIKRLNPQDSGTTEFKYRFKRGDALGTGPSSGDEIDMLGIERTNRF